MKSGSCSKAPVIDLPLFGNGTGSVPKGVQDVGASFADAFTVDTSVALGIVVACGSVATGVLLHAQSIMLVNANMENSTNRFCFTISFKRNPVD